MRINGYHGLIYSEHTEQHLLQNCDVVIDGQNYFYDLYTRSDFPSNCGCDCDRYARFLRRHLDMFKKANVTCYVIFMGGHKDREALLKQQSKPDAIVPILCEDVHREVFKELGFHYVTCEFDSKNECIALAKELNCPVISFDIQFCFADVLYIPNPAYDRNAIQFDHSVSGIMCRKFEMKRFMQKLSLSKQLLAVFIAITDQQSFPLGTFDLSIQKIIAPFIKYPKYSDKKRCEALLSWLSKIRNADAAVTTILKQEALCKPEELRKKICDIISSLAKPKPGGLPMQYLIDPTSVIGSENTINQWFEIGVMVGHISRYCVNLKHYGIMRINWFSEDINENPIMASLDIIKYGFNLLKEFDKSDFILYNKTDGTEKIINCRDGVQNPEEVGIMWRDEFKKGAFSTTLKDLQLFEHFISHIFQNFDFESLNQFPSDMRLFIIAFAYFKLKRGDMESEALMYGVVLCNVLLRLEPDSSEYKEAQELLKEYCEPQQDEVDIIKDHEIFLPLLQFQECLLHLNYLNKICGSPFKPTLFSKTFNGSFAYSVIVDVIILYNGYGMIYLEDKLYCTPSISNMAKKVCEFIYETY